MEHVLHNISQDLTDEEKFLHLLYNADFYVPGTYEETWKFIMEGGNSLKRYCNISLFFENLGITFKNKAG